MGGTSSPLALSSIMDNGAVSVPPIGCPRFFDRATDGRSQRVQNTFRPYRLSVGGGEMLASRPASDARNNLNQFHGEFDTVPSDNGESNIAHKDERKHNAPT
jgi:hypothetical protein